MTTSPLGDSTNLSIHLQSPLPLGAVQDLVADAVGRDRLIEVNGREMSSGPAAIDPDVAVTLVSVTLGQVAINVAKRVAEEELEALSERVRQRFRRAKGVEVTIFGPDEEKITTVRRRAD